MEIDYFFEFFTEADAFADPVVSPFLPNKLRARQNIWAFDLNREVYEITPPFLPQAQRSFYWCMIAQTSTNNVFLSHPKLRFFLVLPSLVLYENVGNPGVGILGFNAISVATAKAIYASHWSLNLDATTNASGFAITSLTGSWLVDLSHDGLATGVT